MERRFRARDGSPERHPGHVDHEADAELTVLLKGGRYEPLELEGTLVEIDTTDFTRVNYQGLLQRIKAVIES